MYSDLKLGYFKMTLFSCNITANDIKIHTRTIVGQVNARNAIPKLLTPKKDSLVGMKAEQVDEGSLLKQKWSKEDQKATRSLIMDFSCVSLEMTLI